MVIIMGTSNCHMVLGKEEKIVPGMCGYVDEGILPGFFGYEAGQSCVGDHFAWFVENCVPAAYTAGGQEARASTSTPCWKKKPPTFRSARAACWRWIGGMATAACWSMSI